MTPPKTSRKRRKSPRGFKLLHTLKGHTKWINEIAWSPDGKFLASGSGDKTVRVWDAETGELHKLLEGHREFVGCVAWSPVGQKLASGDGDGSVRIWDVERGIRNQTLVIPKERIEWVFVTGLAWSPDGLTLASGYSNGAICLWSTQSGELRRMIRHTFEREFTPLAWSPNGLMFASGSNNHSILFWNAQEGVLVKILELPDKAQPRAISGSPVISWSSDGRFLASSAPDRTIRLWEVKSGQQVGILEGHTDEIHWLSFSSDGRLLASSSKDGTVRIWLCDTWERVAVLRDRMKSIYWGGLAFHPKDSILATRGETDDVIEIWSMNFDSRARKLPDAASIHYVNAKVVLIGDSGVGKSGLGLVLAGEQWVETGSTHGRRVWTLDSNEVVREDGLKEIHEILLWDLAGQPDYRIIHQLHLTEVAIALVVFDSRSQTDPFAGVRHWDKALRQAERIQEELKLSIVKFLVAARVDVGRLGVSSERIQLLLRELSFDKFFETSAKESWGVGDLGAAIRAAIDWGKLPSVSSTQLFQSIKTFLVAEKEAGRLLSTIDDLYRAYQSTVKSPGDIPDLREQFETCIGRVESRGLIQRLSFGDLVLLQPELRDAYASALINAAKDEPDGLGCIVEGKARSGDFRFSESERIKNKEQERLLLISTIEELLHHEIALREQGDDGVFLVFPSQLTRENPDLPDPETKTVIFNFEGPVMNIYATLVVRLSHSGIFKNQEMWKNAATFIAKVGGTCGMFLRETGEGSGELTLFFDTTASEETCFQFEEFIHTHLQRRALPERVQRRRVFLCPECGTPVSDLAVRRRRERNLDWISCNVCDPPPPRILLLDRQERLSAVRLSSVPDMNRAADNQRERETAASMLQGKIATKDFDVFLCHNSADKAEVKKIGEQLKEHGILPWLDEWELQPGLPWQRLLEEQMEHIKSAAVFVGTKGIGPWQRQELDAFLREFADRNCPVIPVLLASAPKKPQLPIFLKGMTWVDFRSQEGDPLKRLIWGVTGERNLLLEYQGKTTG